MAENVLLNLILIPRLSLRGAALNTSISEVLVAGALVVFAARAAGPIRWRRSLAGPVAAAAGAGIAMWVLRDAFWVAAAAGAAVYVVVLVAVERLAFPDDARALLGLARRGPT
jgi:O-antigen/teichoic acid export membrane protein